MSFINYAYIRASFLAFARFSRLITFEGVVSRNLSKFTQCMGTAPKLSKRLKKTLKILKEGTYNTAYTKESTDAEDKLEED